MKNLNVSIIILNWNGWQDTIECLESIYQMDYPYFNVILVDNKSEDNSINNIYKYCEGRLKVDSKFFNFDSKTKPINIIQYNINDQDKLKKNLYCDILNLYLIKNDKNYGFAEGNNIGIRFAKEFLNPDYILLLNNDTVVDKKCLNELMNTATKTNAGIVGPKVLFYKNEKKIQSLGTTINWFLGETKMVAYGNDDEKLNNIPKCLDGVSGCGILIKKKVFEKINLLDPIYFLYYEDTDLCIRAKRAGFKIKTSSTSVLWHKDSVSSKKISGTREFYSARNHFLFMKRYANRVQYMCFLIYYFCFRFWFNLSIIIFYHKELETIKPYIKGVLRGLHIKKI